MPVTNLSSSVPPRLSGKSPDIFLKRKEAILIGAPPLALSSTSLGILILAFSLSIGGSSVVLLISSTNNSSTWNTIPWVHVHN